MAADIVAQRACRRFAASVGIWLA